jgi:AbrB family looped-hinge helix DNA binding protein
MSTTLTTRMSSKGQVVIPEALRKQMHLDSGTEFVVLGEGDVLILKSLAAPDIKDFQRLISQARAQAAKAGLTPGAIGKVIAKVRAAR